MSDNGITEKGFVRKRLDTIIDEISLYLKNNIGIDPREAPQSLISVLVVSFADVISELWELHEQVYDSQYPSMAEGVNLDNALQFAGITRKSKERSKYLLACTGVDGTTIPYNSIVKSTTQPVRQLRSASNQKISRENFCKIIIRPVNSGIDASTKFSYTITMPVDGGASHVTFSNTFTGYTSFESVFLALSADLQSKASSMNVSIAEEITDDVDDNGNYLKEIIITCNNISAEYSIELSPTIIVTEVVSNLSYETVEFGDINLPTGSITEIVTSIDGFNAVTNRASYTAGRLAETDQEIRADYARRISARGTNTIDSICAQLLEGVSGCVYAVGYENVTDVEDEDGRPPHSFEIVVQGGNDTDVAAVIFPNKPAGIRTYGSEYSYAIDSFGKRQVVQFSRIRNQYLLFSVTLEVGEEYDNNYVEAITELLSSKEFEAGEDIKLQNLIPQILETVSGVNFVEIKGQLSDSSNISDAVSSKWTRSIVPVGLRIQPVTSSSGIEVKLSGG